MKIKWTDEAQRTLHRYMFDQEGVRAIARAVIALADDPTPPEAVPWGKDGDYRLHVGQYRVMYRVMTDEIVIGHVSRRAT
jgi:mRNA interferase RelE/StbE